MRPRRDCQDNLWMWQWRQPGVYDVFGYAEIDRLFGKRADMDLWDEPGYDDAIQRHERRAVL